MEREIHSVCERFRHGLRSDGCAGYIQHIIYRDHCAACGCHRDYHRTVVVVDVEINPDHGYNVYNYGERGSATPQALVRFPSEPRPVQLIRSLPMLPVRLLRGESSRRVMFNVVQRAEMAAFAEENGWTLSHLRSEEGKRLVTEFCGRIGVCRLRLKDWMRRNKPTVGYGGDDDQEAPNQEDEEEDDQA